jgi:hypothetical protein
MGERRGFGCRADEYRWHPARAERSCDEPVRVVGGRWGAQDRGAALTQAAMTSVRVLGRGMCEKIAGASRGCTAKTLGLALDLEAGTMLVSVDGAEWVAAPLPQPCVPGAAVGAALFPALSGYVCTRLRCNWGVDAERPMRHAPPPGDYRAVGLLPRKVPPSSPLCCLVGLSISHAEFPRPPGHGCCVTTLLSCRCPPAS